MKASERAKLFREVAALPVRMRNGVIEVLLVTTRDTGRWVIPKGWPMGGKPDCDAAAIEAMEEAGAVGSLSLSPLEASSISSGVSSTSISSR